MTIDEEATTVAAGDSIYVPSGSKHGIKNTGDELLEYLTANSPAFTSEYEDALWPTSPAIGIEPQRSRTTKDEPR
jgi:mannose-6-phosphate isomerase-like protein (cupin superfamily)